MKRRIPALLLAALLLLSCIPTSAFATGSGYFYFSAETKERLVVAPVRIDYSDGQTVREALNNSDAVALTTDGSNGFITAINGVEGNYAYGSDTGIKLDESASDVQYFRFTETTELAAPSDGVQQLMRVMADYQLEPEDVRGAAKSAYDDALKNYLDVSDTDAAGHASAITSAMEAYKNSQSTTCTVTFAGYSGGQYEVSAENAYGKVFEDEEHTGVLSLPVGEYTFCVRSGHLLVSGEITVSGPMTVNASLPSGGWFDADGFQLSGGYGDDFADDLYDCTVEEHTVTTLVPDSFTGKLYPCVTLNDTDAAVTAIYTDANGTQREKAIAVGSQVVSIDNALKKGAQGNTVILRASRTGLDGYIQSEDLTLQLDRMPTLSALRVTDGKTAQAADVAFSDTVLEYTYRIVSTDLLKIFPTAASSQYTVKVNGNTPDSDGSATVSVNGDTDILVTVSGGGYTTIYTLHIRPGEGKQVTFTMDTDTAIVVVNKNGEELEYTKKFEGSKVIYGYTLVPGEAYSYVATRDTWYHAQKSFTLEASATTSSSYEVSVEADDRLTELALGSGTASGKKGSIRLSQAFSAETHRYTATVPDYSSGVYLWATASTGSVQALYQTQSSAKAGADKAVSIASGNKGTNLAQALLSGSAYGNTVTVRVTYEDSTAGVTYYTDYELRLERSLSLKDLTVSCQGGSVTLNRTDGENTGYSREKTAYSVLVPAAASSVALNLQTHTDSPKYGDTDNGYQIAVNGQTVTDGTATVPLSGGSDTEVITVTLTNRYNSEAKTVYTVTVNKAATTAVNFALEPGDALIYLYETGTGNRVWPGEEGSFALSEGFTYFCSITRSGYVSQSGAMTLSSENGAACLTFGEAVYTDPGAVSVTLEKAPDNTAIDTTITAEWGDFRGSASNNGVTDAKTPISAEEGTLYWATKLGEGYDSRAVGCPILVDDCLIVYAGNQIYRIDKATGEILKTGTMADKSSFAITNPTYSGGIILVGLSGGRIQAFNADTLESLWLYTDPLGGQPNCPITVHNGYAYTGFWNAEKRDAAFVCISLTDEDPSGTLEAKAATWRHVQDGGFYWAGAYVCDDFVMVGTDDGAAGCSYLYLFDPLTGAVLDSRSGFNGDIRSAVSYDAATNAYYFTSKGGSFYRAKAEKGADGWKIIQCDELKLTNGADNSATPPMSTSTPVVYNGRAYVGVSGTGQFDQYSGHNITVIDLDCWEIAYTVPTQGYRSPPWALSAATG